MKVDRRTLVVLALSHAVAAVVGAGLAHVHGARTEGDMATFMEGIARDPLSQAAHLAFHHGPPDHAEVLLNALPIRDTNDLFEWGEILMRDLRLAVVYKELGDAAAEQAALTSVVENCRLLNKTGCTLESARRAASKIGEYRTP